MRTTRRFTPNLLRRWEEEGRGDGRKEDYEPWHQVTRGDPSSRGRSHIIYWVGTGRQHHFLSDGEAVAFYFSAMIPGLIDIREQFPLQTKEWRHELCEYSVLSPSRLYTGTEDIAKKIGVRHPSLVDGENKELWRLSTSRH